MATLFSTVNQPLEALMESIQLGTIGLPDIQRPFVWKDKKVRDLFDSMYRGYPVGYLLLWENANVNDPSVKHIGMNQKQKVPNLLVVDGQQRLTSLYAVIKQQEVIRSNFQTERIVISFNPITEKFVVPDAATKRSNEYIQDISIVWQKDFSSYSFITNYMNVLSKSRSLTDNNRAQIANNINKLENLKHYQFSTLELLASTTEEQVSEIFVRINSQGQKLNQSDFIMTLMSVFWEEGRIELEKFSESSQTPAVNGASPFNYIIEPKPDQLLRVSIGLAFKRAVIRYAYSILRGKDLKTNEFNAKRRDEQFELLKTNQKHVLDLTNWHEFLKCIQTAGYTKSDIVSSKNNVMYTYLMYLIGHVDYKLTRQELRSLISRWFFMVAITGRYTSSPESKMESDLILLRNVYNKDEYITLMNKIINSELTHDYWESSLPVQLDSTSSSGPLFYAFIASQNLLNANALFSNLTIPNLLQAGLRSKKSPCEIHHIFPKAYLHRKGFIHDQQTNQIANYALVEWTDNIAIKDKSPADYHPIMSAQIQPEAMKRQEDWHALPENWSELEYTEFLTKRRKLMAEVIKRAFEGIV